tara:strand:- start:36 stop:518 length:483 start_codon:yes stop_codon:yes gene_type:complete
MKNTLIKFSHIFLYLVVIGSFLSVQSINYAEQKTNHLLPLKNNNQNLDPINNNLLPMPYGDIEEAASKVQFERNPFNDISKSEYPIINNLNTNFRFKGLVKSNNLVKAIIESDSEEKFYKLGDTLENGFIINIISFEENFIDISDGTNKYRLKLSKFSGS